MPQVFISEEYGYRNWIADLTDEEYADLVRRWKTMKNLNCLVPVRFIVPQAVELYGSRRRRPENSVFCHIHEAEDSRLGGCDYTIPYEEGAPFEIDGKSYDAMILFDADAKATQENQ